MSDNAKQAQMATEYEPLKNKAMEDMISAVERISTPEEFKSMDKSHRGLLPDLKNLAEAFTIIAKRIEELDPDLQQKLQAKQQPAAKSKPNTPKR